MYISYLLHTFKQIKHIFKYESYLNLPFHLCTAITRLWISIITIWKSKQEDSTYQHYQSMKEPALIALIKWKIEDELHFLFNCSAYQTSNEFINLITYVLMLNGTFNDFSDINKWIFISLSENQNMNYLLEKLIIKTNEIKNNLINYI